LLLIKWEKVFPDLFAAYGADHRYRTGSRSVAPEFSGMCDIFQFVFIDQDRDKIRLDAERGDECIREFFCDFAFLGG
jgi:hypothetical protein